MTLGPWVLLGLWGLAVVGISAWTRLLLARVLRNSFEYVVLPGTLVHELSHAAGCLLTGARITRFALLERDGGYVAHTEPKLPVIGQVLISLAPLIGCGAGLALCAKQLGLMTNSGRLASDVVLSGEGIGAFVSETISAHGAVMSRLGGLDYGRPMTYVWVYLAVCFAAMLGPSRQDLRNAALGVLTIVAVLWLAGVALKAVGLDVSALWNLPRHAWGGLSATVVLSVLMCMLALCVRACQAGIGAMRHSVSRDG